MNEGMAAYMTHKPGITVFNSSIGRNDGFTLVEMLVATVVFGIAVVMLTTIFSLVQTAQRNALYFTIATHAARSELDKARSSGYASLSYGGTYPFTSTLPASLPPNSTGNLVVAASAPTNAPDSKKVDVTVTYPLGGTTKTVTITGYVNPPAEGSS